MKTRRLLSFLLIVVTLLSIFQVPALAEDLSFNLFRLLGHESEERIAANTAVLTKFTSREYGGLSGGEVIAYVVEPGATITFNREVGFIEVTDISLKTDHGIVYSSLTGERSEHCTVTGETGTGTYLGQEYSYFLPGATVTFNTPGDRWRIIVCENRPGGTFKNTWYKSEQWGIVLNVKNPSAKYTNAKVSVNGKPTEFEAYVLNGNNYFKLRDLAYVLTGTDKQFDVSWDKTNQLIEIITGKAYTVAGGELKKGDGKDKTAIPYTNGLNFDSLIVPASAYTINSNNYFKLRDICKFLDIGVTWDNTSKTIGIDTSIGYTE